MSTEPGKILDAGLPSSPDVEKAVLGAMILDARTIDVVAARLHEEHFYKTRHQYLFRALLDMHDRGTSIDFAALIEEMKRRRQLEDVGGPGYIVGLEQYVYDVGNVEQHIQIVLEKYQRRELIRASQEIQEEALQERDELQDLLDRAEKRIFDLSEQRSTSDFVDIGHLTMETIEEIVHRQSRPDELRGVQTGYVQLDEHTGGFQPSDLLILAARPSVGKTALALNIALNVGGGMRGLKLHPEHAKGVGIFSLEMSKTQINERMLSTLSKIPMKQMHSGKLSKRQAEELYSCARDLHGLPIYIDDTPSISVLEVRAKARRLMARVPNLSLLMIDYLQLMRSGGRVENRQQEVAEITRALKGIARELNIPVLALSQLSRLVEQRKGKLSKPVLSDLRESGAIEQDADVVMFIHREKRMDKLDGEDGEEASNQETPAAEPAELIIAKQRNGPVGSIDLVFFKNTTTFHNMARERYDDHPGF